MTLLTSSSPPHLGFFANLEIHTSLIPSTFQTEHPILCKSIPETTLGTIDQAQITLNDYRSSNFGSRNNAILS
jgi:hypothetical protein